MGGWFNCEACRTAIYIVLTKPTGKQFRETEMTFLIIEIIKSTIILVDL